MNVFLKEAPGIMMAEIHPEGSSYQVQWVSSVPRVKGLEAIKQVFEDLRGTKEPFDPDKKIFPPGIELHRLGKRVNIVHLHLAQFDPPGIDELMEDLGAFETRVNTPFADFGIGRLPGTDRDFVGVMSGVKMSKAITRLMVATNPDLYAPQQVQLRGALDSGLASFPSLQPRVD